jgi:murein DD-endopeptidase MepM/ murein hydrolase activator NlpD
MAKSQFPVDGKPGKAWKVTSPFGWRVHPIKKTKKHHNGVDIWQGGATTYLEACFDGKVVGVSTSTDPNGAGNKVVVQSTVMGKKVTWTYFHMVAGSIKVKVGQKIEAGTIVGKMGETGFATGKHLHWEIWKGHLKSQPMAGFASGKGFYNPMDFTKAVIEFEKAHVEAGKATAEDAPATLAPTHSVPEIPTVAVPTEAKVVPATAVAPAAPVAKPVLKVGSKGTLVKVVQKKIGVTADGAFGPKTAAALKAYQTKHGLPATGVVDAATWTKLG